MAQKVESHESFRAEYMKMLDERNFLDSAYVKKRDECDLME